MSQGKSTGPLLQRHSLKFDRVCRTFVELNLGSTHGASSESDVAVVSLQSRSYYVRDMKSTASEPGLTWGDKNLVNVFITNLRESV